MVGRILGARAMSRVGTKLLTRVGRLLTGRPVRRLARCQDGAAAVEFALVAAPFLALLVAIFETAQVFFAQQVLQTGTSQAARLIMTGQAQAQAMTATQFKQAVCTNSSSLFSCGGIYVNVQKFSSFPLAELPNPIKNGRFDSSGLTYSPGNPGDIVVVQVFYQWPVYMAPLGFDISNLSGGLRLLTGTAAFRNEPQ